METIKFINKIRILANKYNGVYKEEIVDVLKNDECFYEMNYDTSYKLLKLLGLDEEEIELSMLELLR